MMKEIYRLAHLYDCEKSEFGLKKIEEGKYLSFSPASINSREREYKLVGNKLLQNKGDKGPIVCGDVIYFDDVDFRFRENGLMHEKNEVIKYYESLLDTYYYFYPDGTLHIVQVTGEFDDRDKFYYLHYDRIYDPDKIISFGKYEINGNFVRLIYDNEVDFWWYHEGYIYRFIYVSEDLLDKLIFFIGNLETTTVDEPLPITSHNALRHIYSKCPNILNDRRLLRAYLSDYFYDDKTLLNVLMLSFDEGIPQEIEQTKTNDGLILSRMKKKLIISYAISDSVADQVIKMWVEAIKGESDFV